MNSYIILGVVLVVAIIAIWFVVVYNKLVKLRNSVKEQWSQVDVQLKKRFDLIPNIVETVKGYAKHEKETFELVVNARNAVLKAKTPDAELKADKELSGALTKLFALSEAYPELKADTTFIGLQENLNEVEENISTARKYYNKTVLEYKNTIETFPTVLVAKIFGFKEEQFFETKEEEKENVNVKF